MKKSSTVVIINNEKVLAVSRKDDETQMGLPGGKVELNETFEDAAIRETFEETGLVVELQDEVYSEVDYFGYFCKAFKAKIVGDVPDRFKKIEGEGKVDWVTWQTLFEGPFKEFNKNLFNQLKNG